LIPADHPCARIEWKRLSFRNPQSAIRNDFMPTIIFLCVANAARSQMAEGLAKVRAPTGWRVFSAGSHPANRVSQRAIAVMNEIGIDISRNRPKGMDEVPVAEADFVVTLCGEEVCPIVPGKVRKLHWPLKDPASATGSEAEQLQVFRDTRDEIDRRLSELWSQLLADGRISG
jgi:arsenate reductase